MIYKPIIKYNNGKLIIYCKIKENILNDYNIIPIWFPYQQYEALQIFLKKLYEQISINIKKQTIPLTNPPTKTDSMFLYKDKEIKKLVLSKQNMTLVNGTGGIGKTTYDYIYR